MACNTTPTNCEPAPCPPAPAPVMPRCDIALPDGNYTWATVVVEGGCIIAVQSGLAPLYQPDSCCATPGGGEGGGEGLDGPPGPAGTPATVSIGQIFTVAPGTPASVVNVGTASNAIFDFYIPEGEPGEDGASVTGVTRTDAGIVLEDGLVKAVPLIWPPIMMIQGAIDNPTVSFVITKGADGIATVNIVGLLAMQNDIQSYVDFAVQGLQTQVNEQADAITLLQTQLLALTARVDICCPP